jgi:hypothetical protein
MYASLLGISGALHLNVFEQPANPIKRFPGLCFAGLLSDCIQLSYRELIERL